MDSQSVKTTCVGGTERGFDGYKRVNGRKRHLLTDSLGLLIAVVVTGANVADVTAGRMLLVEAQWQEPSLKTLLADRGYRSQNLSRLAAEQGMSVEIVSRASLAFEVEPRRWVVERTFVWQDRYRRLSKDYERLPESSESMCLIASLNQLLHRLAP